MKSPLSKRKKRHTATINRLCWCEKRGKKRHRHKYDRCDHGIQLTKPIECNTDGVYCKCGKRKATK